MTTPKAQPAFAAPAGSAVRFDRRGADRLAYECALAVRAGKIDSRHPVADALLDYLDVGCVGGPTSVMEWMALYESGLLNGGPHYGERYVIGADGSTRVEWKSPNDPAHRPGATTPTQ